MMVRRVLNRLQPSLLTKTNASTFRTLVMLSVVWPCAMMETGISEVVTVAFVMLAVVWPSATMETGISEAIRILLALALVL